jgi:hypothetical protein
MSQAFVREQEPEWLHEIPGTMQALVNYLTRENNGIRVYEKRNYFDTKLNKEAFEMSNGLSYTKDADGKWCIS